ncbi:MAG: hypothetical protein EZS28_004058 [Streblomastix strix]|uniref:NrS-1 polymerase-like helicase domain-containing protein n=1 Tax=Streblomastix strix TaxID=222440 RepID=A0A5J4WZ60_9EUKA|nr:MAG: hypothetical protein EZS28_004058 [Streblomastix strix]
MSRQTTRNVSITKSGVIARELMDKMIEEQEKNKTNENIFESVDEQDNKLLDDLLSKYVNETSKRIIPEFFVKWYPVIDVSSDLKNICTYYTTKINDFTFDGSVAFNEVILPDKYCHPYFDFDHIESNDQYASAIIQLDSLVSEFGQYSIGGYSNDPKICATHNLKYITDAAKKISIHVVFYEKRILQQDMMEIVKKVGNQNTRRFVYDINEFVDDSVYKLKYVSKSSRQIFRYILSSKNYRGKESIYIAGQLCKPNDQPFNQIIQCIQDDSSTGDVISNWNNVIHKLPSLKEREKEKTNAKRLVDVDNGVAEVAGDGKIITKTHIKNIKIDDVDFDDNLIWFASIFQQVKLKIGTMMNFIGQQGCGKSFAFETIYELLGIFALKNVDELSKIFGKFNALAATAILINFNEIQDATDSFNLQHKMKSAITQASGIVERKGVDSVESEIWSNFTCTCNDVNANPAEKVHFICAYI